MKIKIALSIMFLIALSGAGIGCGSSKVDKITGPSSSGNSSFSGNALDLWSDKSKIGVGETAIITTKIYNTDGTTPIRGLSDCGATSGVDLAISVIYSANTYGTLSATSSSATIKGGTSTTCPDSWGAYYFTISLTGAKMGTAAITATRFEMEKTIYVDIE